MITNDSIFFYGEHIFDKLVLIKYEPTHNMDGLRYMLLGSVDGLINIELVKSYWTGTLLVKSPSHVKFTAYWINQLYQEIL